MDSTTSLEDSRDTHLVRACIFCGRDNSEDLFSYTYDFLNQNRNVSKERLEELGWRPETTSTIVRCKDCGCNYVRDIFIMYENAASVPLLHNEMQDIITKQAKPISFENKNYLSYCRALASTLLRAVARRQPGKNRISLLDFGSSLSSFSLTARVSGFDSVTLYDAYFRPNIQDAISRKHPIDFCFVRDKNELHSLAPFDVLTCQAAVEHFYDPRAELKLMHDLLTDDGVLFITNPCLPLNERAELLKREALQTDPKVRRRLRKDYHIQHVNFPSPKQFSKMLHDAGFKEVPTLLYYLFLSESMFGAKNIVRMGKALVLYFLDIFKIPHARKTNYFVVKR